MNKKTSILIVEDDRAMCETCVRLFGPEGFETIEAADGAAAMELLRRRGDIDIVLTDILMPEMSGLDLLKKIRALDNGADVILMTGYGSIKNAVEAMKLGAVDYITKPLDADELQATVDRVLELRRLRGEVARFRTTGIDRSGFAGMVGGSACALAMFDTIKAAAKTGSTVFILGESGTGKELVARAIHNCGSRADAPYIPVNCASIPADLFESELFGNTKGAFTGAATGRMGLFRSAEKGTLLLDEILEVPLASQAKLLRVLQERRLRPVGSDTEFDVDVRIIASTNRDVRKAVREERFRNDLYYRLGVVTVQVPPLRDRIDDIPLLVDFFIDKFNRISHRIIRGIQPEALLRMSRYAWPGNIRELSAVVEHAFALGESEMIETADLPDHIVGSPEVPSCGEISASATPTLQHAEKDLVERALKVSNGNKSLAARRLATTRPRLYNLIKKHGL